MKFVIRCCLFLSLVMIAAKLPAVLMRPLAVEELARHADLVLHGTVTDKTCVRDPHGRIVTRVQLEVAEVWKGKLATNSFLIVHGGGKIGNIRSEVSGQVEYEVGEEVVAFLAINHRGEGVTLGLAQGKFHVWKDKVSGEKFAHNIFYGATEKAAAHGKKKSERLALKELERQAEGGVQ
jgi:hypothetical protein